MRSSATAVLGRSWLPCPRACPSSWCRSPADQPANAAACIAAGVGRLIDPTELTADLVLAAVDALLGDPGYRRRAEAVAAEIAAMPGPDAAVPEAGGAGRAGRPDRGWTQLAPGRRDRPRIRAMYDVATAAVEAALNAGAGYADARVMETRTESMSARNGSVESLEREERAGVGVRALIGSSWGFFAVPDVGSGAARRAGEQAAAVARASTLVPGAELRPRPGDRDPGLVAERVPRGPMVGHPRREGRPARGRHPDDGRERRRRLGGKPPRLGHPQVARQQRGPPDRPAHRRMRRIDLGDSRR